MTHRPISRIWSARSPGGRARTAQARARAAAAGRSHQTELSPDGRGAWPEKHCSRASLEAESAPARPCCSRSRLDCGPPRRRDRKATTSMLADEISRSHDQAPYELEPGARATIALGRRTIRELADGAQGNGAEAASKGYYDLY